MADESPNLYDEYTVRDLLKLGMTALKSKRVTEASAMLYAVCERFTNSGERVPPAALSLYALTLAHQNRMKDAIDTCRLAVRREPDNATIRLHMARIYLLADSRRRAFEELQKGLALSPRHPDLHAFHKELGTRRKPVIGVLSRSNPINVKLGKARSHRKAAPARSARG